MSTVTFDESGPLSGLLQSASVLGRLFWLPKSLKVVMSPQ
jgi:hypothetical protein